MNHSSRRAIVAVSLALFAPSLFASPTELLSQRYDLRVYGPVTAQERPVQDKAGSYRQMRITAANPDKARIVQSKLLSDFTTLPTVTAQEVVAGEARLTALAFEGGRRILPVLMAGDKFVDVYCFATQQQLDGFLHSAGTKLQGAEKLKGRQHPYFMDLWDRHCMGFWYVLMKDKGFTDDEDFAFFRKYGLAVNSVHNFSPIVARCDRDDLGYKFNRWMDVSNFAYDAHPEAASSGDPDTTFSTDYYGDVPFAENPIERAQTAELLEFLKQFAKDDHFVSITDPHGETGPGEECFLGLRERNEYSRRDLVHYLRDLQKLTLAQVGERWYGDAARFKSWDTLAIPRERDFFGWVDGKSQDLSGTWRLRILSREDGEKEQVYQPGFDDASWLPFQEPGTQQLADNVGKTGGWLRFGFVADAAQLNTGKPVYLTLCPFNYAQYASPCTVYLNGKKLADLTFGHGAEWGQMDVSGILKSGSNVLAVYSPKGNVRGPRFLTPRKAEPFPTSDRQLNARLYDVREWVTDDVARSNARVMEYIRGVDPVRPIKMMAFYAMIDVMMPHLERLGGYPHCTGEGDYMRPWFKRYGYLRGIQDSSEPSQPAKTMSQLMRQFFTMTFEGMNTHDYFIHLHSITGVPEFKAWYEKNVPYFELMGRFDLKKPEVAVARSWRVDRVFIPWVNCPGDSGYQNDLGRGDIQQAHYSFVYCSERDLQDHLLNGYKVILDDNFHTLKTEDVDNLENWVKAGGTLVLNQRSGRNTYLEGNTWPISRLTGCTATTRPMTGNIQFEKDPVILKSYAGKAVPNNGNVSDWQLHQYYSDCVALEPKGADTSVVARYEDGKPAIVVRTLGKGRVVVLGSSFYRNSHDEKGYYVGTPEQAVFYKNLLSDLGVAPVVTSEQDALWAERFIANNDSTEMLILGNQSDTESLQGASAVWDLGFVPKRVFDPATGADLPVKIDGTKVAVTGLNLSPYEMRYYAVERTNVELTEPVTHWLFRQSQMWRAVAPGREVPKPDSTWPIQPFGRWLVKQFETEKEARAAMSVDYTTDASWQSLIKGDWASQGLKTGKGLWSVSRKAITVDKKWLHGLRGVELLNSLGKSTIQDLAINGVLIEQKGKVDQDKILSALRPGENLLTILCNAQWEGNGGMASDFVFCPVPGANAKTMNLASNWTAYVSDTVSKQVSLPASGDWLMARQSVKIPEQYRNCQVWIESKGASIVSTNGRCRYNSNNYGARYHRGLLLVNITPDIRFGQENELALGAGSWNNGFHTAPMKLESVNLLFVPKEGK